MLVKTKIRFLFLAFFFAAIIFTTCESPMGMGQPIDWEPPVLTLEPKPPNPMYVKYGAQITGTVTDNIGVERVILRDSTTGEQLFTAALLPGNRWQLNLNFSSSQNGQTILADVVAYDKAGNSGAESIASIVLYIDIVPPIVDDIWIQRTSERTADLLSYLEFKDLEINDPKGEVSKYADTYQNGAFYVQAKISEDDTSIKSVTLQIFDSKYPDIDLIDSLEPLSGSSFYSPKWYLTEDMILDAGASKLPLGLNYKSDYKNLSGKRYYYRLRVVAIDKSDNISSIEDQDYICLWNEADFPKGILDPRVVGEGSLENGNIEITATKGSTLPVEFWDDDRIDWAYAALFTKEQWAGSKPLASGFSLTQTNDAAKFEALSNRLSTGPAVYNWRYDRKGSTTESVVNLTAGGANEKTYYIVTGNDAADFGDFVLVTLVKDSKLSPHIAGEYPPVAKYRKYIVTLVDENAPLIVFDKQNGSPEENTFPTIDSTGKFRIHGYTLREDKAILGTVGGTGSGGFNKVEKFRLAWVPIGIAGSVETAVKNALSKGTVSDADFPATVQWWDLSAAVSSSILVDQISDGTRFRKQMFSKTFSILGAQDDLKSGYKNFTNKDGNNVEVLENATKLFIFYAEDNMGHGVFTQFYLLGNKTPPQISVYDITDKLTMTSPPAPNVYDSSPTGEITSAYMTARTNFNASSYPQLKAVSKAEGDITANYKAYPRGTIIKLWADATANGALAIKEIKMQDVTYEGQSPALGFYNNTDFALGYVEYFPEVSQRVFLFTATDQLGNEAKVQRTIAIASAATLTSITTAKQNGTYPKDEVIELKANFDGMIKLQSNTNGTRPKLNVLYQIKDSGGVNRYGVQQIECQPVTTDTLYLTFNFSVPENAQGTLETIYLGIPNKPAENPAVTGFPAINTTQMLAIDRPITVNSNNKILDSVRGDSAYTPGNVTGFFWNSAVHSLQDTTLVNGSRVGKDIKLDGILPVINTIAIVNTKAPYSTTPNNTYYLKSGESLSFELTASKNLKISGDTSLRFRLQRPDNSYYAYNDAAFAYNKVSAAKIVFTLDVNRANIPVDGRLTDISIINPGNITDEVGNKVVVTTLTVPLAALNNSNQIYFDLTPPPKPVTSLTAPGNAGDIGANPTTTLLYSNIPYMGIDDVPTASEPYGTETKQYSLNGGLEWVTFPNPKSGWTTATTSPDPLSKLNILNGQWNIKTRYLDKAGNEGATTDQLIHVNGTFPKLIGVNVVQPNATYVAGQRLDFTLDFDDVVNFAAPLTGVTLTLADTTSTANVPGGANNTYEYTINAGAVASKSTVTFTWNLAANTKDMPNGLKITALNISGLKDRFGNSGPATVTVTAANVTPAGGAAVTYNFGSVKVSTIKPTVRSREPQNAQNRTGNINLYTADPDTVTSTTVATGSISADNKTIKLNFSKAMQKGNGTITIRPHGAYAIPAVFEHEGYYIETVNGNVTQDNNKDKTFSEGGTGRTYVSGFYDIFNSINNTDRNTLIGSTSMSSPAVSNVTGLATGPYQKTTHGLTQGAGYTGNYGNPATQGAATIALPGNNAPGPRDSNRMIPDTTTKWVLDYQYDNLFATTAGVVNNTRAVLDRAKFRWQEIAVTAANVAISGTAVTITLSEPLLPGLQWDLYYTEGTFTDEAGNTASGVTRGDYWFWSKGAQRPVIRVDRKSYDARPGGTNANYSGDSFTNGSTYNANGYNGTIASFNTINYRINSETPQARIFYNTQSGADGVGSITAAWTGNAVTANTSLNITANANILWQGPKTGVETIGTWVRPNLIFRSHQDGQYNIMEDGINISKNVGGSAAGGFAANNTRYYGFRSYNKDATLGELDALVVPNTNGATYAAFVSGSFTYDNLQASKNYVAAVARIDHTNTSGTYSSTTAVNSQKGYEGVFRTVVAMNQAGLTAAGSNGAAAGTNWTATTMPLMIAGTNVRSGLPTISNFPLKDGVHRNDSRYIKVFNRNDKQFYWVTSEIVSLWYIQLVGRGDGQGSYSRMGDIEDWISAGYGDLSYALNLATW